MSPTWSNGTAPPHPRGPPHRGPAGGGGRPGAAAGPRGGGRTRGQRSRRAPPGGPPPRGPGRVAGYDVRKQRTPCGATSAWSSRTTSRRMPPGISFKHFVFGRAQCPGGTTVSTIQAIIILALAGAAHVLCDPLLFLNVIGGADKADPGVDGRGAASHRDCRVSADRVKQGFADSARSNEMARKRKVRRRVVTGASHPASHHHRRSDGGPERRQRCPDGGSEHRYEWYTEGPPKYQAKMATKSQEVILATQLPLRSNRIVTERFEASEEG